MKLDRRVFLSSGTAAVTAMALGRGVSAQPAPEPKPGASLRLGSQLGVIPGNSLEEKLEKMKNWGMEAVELPGDVAGKVDLYKTAAANAGLKISAVCWGSRGGSLVSTDENRRKEGIQALKDALAAAGELESTGVIFVPAFNHESDLCSREIYKILLDIMPEIGEYAESVNSRVLFEPLNRGETYYMRQLAHAASVCRDINSAGVQMMGDFYHMGIEETSDYAAFISAGDYLHHVHLASRRRVLPGQDDRSFISGFRGLKFIGYQQFCSFECGVDGDREVEIPKALDFLRQQWERA